jgi:hypothetical protein
VETIFGLAFLAVLPLWGLMILAPRWDGTVRVVSSPWAFAPLAVVYAALVLPLLGEFVAVFSRPELVPVAAFLAAPAGVTIAWVHLLVFDAFVGRWAFLDSRERGISGWAMAPVLALVLFAGPLGFLAYLLVRAIVR